MKALEQILRNGDTIEFMNKDGDLMSITFKKILGGSVEFKLEFNQQIYTFKIFEYMKNKINHLKKKYGLEIVIDTF